MSKETIVLMLGLLVLLVPSLGIPTDWKEYILLGAGALLMLIGYLLRRAAYWRRLDLGNGDRGTDTFYESRKQTRIDFNKPLEE